MYAITCGTRSLISLFISVPYAWPISYGDPYTCSTVSGGDTPATWNFLPLVLVVSSVGASVTMAFRLAWPSLPHDAGGAGAGAARVVRQRRPRQPERHRHRRAHAAHHQHQRQEVPGRRRVAAADGAARVRVAVRDGPRVRHADEERDQRPGPAGDGVHRRPDRTLHQVPAAGVAKGDRELGHQRRPQPHHRRRQALRRARVRAGDAGRRRRRRPHAQQDLPAGGLPGADPGGVLHVRRVGPRDSAVARRRPRPAARAGLDNRRALPAVPRRHRVPPGGLDGVGRRRRRGGTRVQRAHVGWAGGLDHGHEQRADGHLREGVDPLQGLQAAQRHPLHVPAARHSSVRQHGGRGGGAHRGREPHVLHLRRRG
mmetsp:Transcript_26735/g.92880  ORF Transcript_26735/g.92880 Transcript_26735/m.92880 type:complete len:370 (+) Transcript_26735:1261-2370(+)